MLHQVIANLLHRSGEIRSTYPKKSESEIRVGIFFGPAINCVNFSFGVASCLLSHEVRYCDAVFGVMGGAFAGAGYLGGNPKLGRSIVEEENCSKDFIRKLSVRHRVNISFLRQTIEKGGWDLNSIMRNPASFFVGVTSLDGRFRFIDGKPEKGNPIDTWFASCLPPVPPEKPIVIGNEPFVSGAISNPLPIQEASEMFGLTDMLVILNQPEEPRSLNRMFSEKLGARFIRPKHPGLIEAFLHRDQRFNQGLELARSGKLPNGCRVGIISPEKTLAVPKLCTDVKRLSHLADHGEFKMLEAFHA